MNSAKSNPTIAAVVVTHNRLRLLQECIAALRAQTRQLDEIIVVNNASTDGTAEWLADQRDLTVITQGNLGSSGGQYTGIKTAYQKGHDWFWCMDDDTIPTASCLAELTDTRPFTEPTTGYLCSLVVWKDGQLHQGNRPTPCGTDWYATVMHEHLVQVTHATFVSLLVSRRAVAKVGLPVKDFFIWFDDWEYTQRISTSFKNFLVLDSKAVHATAANVPNLGPGWRKGETAKGRYGLRNEIAMIKLEPGSRWTKARRIIHRLRLGVWDWMRGQTTFTGLAWQFRGALARPSIEFP